MHNRNRRVRGRRRDATAEALFEQALFGGRQSGRQPFDPRTDRKTLQLCRQVQRALSLALGGEVSMDGASEMFVASVEPLGGPSQLLVRIALPPDASTSPAQVIARLNERAPRLRAPSLRSETCRNSRKIKINFPQL